MFIAFIINTLMFTYFERKLSYGKAISDDKFDQTHFSFLIMGGVHTFLATFTLIFYLFFRTPIVIQEGWRKHFESYGNLMMNFENKGANWENIDLSFRKVAISEYSSKDKANLLKKIHDQLDEPNIWCSAEVFIYNSTFLFGDRDLQYLASVITLSAFAIVLNESFYYSIQLLEIVQHFEMLKNVTRAVTKNMDQVLYAGAFGLLVINFYVFIAFFYWQPDFWMGSDSNWTPNQDGEGLCSNMVHCF